jgi:hypothetical protein
MGNAKYEIGDVKIEMGLELGLTGSEEFLQG